MKIYTKSGDNGFTSLHSGERVRKDNLFIEIIGELDELNSHIGYLISMIDHSQDEDFLHFLQNILFDLSTCLCDEQYSLDGQCSLIEREIDLIQSELPLLHSFILPGGCQIAAQAHICRSVCRRVERRVVSSLDNCSVSDSSIRILNRISDYFYVFARKVNFERSIVEKKWQKTCK